MSLEPEPDTALIRTIEEAAAAAVPPAVTEMLGGWRLRFNHGVKRRPNSVLANDDDGLMALPDKLEQVEAFYARHGLPARFQLCPASRPDGLAETLLRRGYTRDPDGTSVQLASLIELPETVLLEPTLAPLSLSPRATDAWVALYCEIDGLSGKKADAFREMISRFPGEVRYATGADSLGQAAAVGVGIVCDGFLGLFNIATHPAARRQGLATHIVAGLCSWARDQHVSGAYLQVLTENKAALAVYRQFGFRTCYNYFYLEQT